MAGSTTKVRTRLDPEVRRQQIVDAAARAFDGRDPHEVTFEEIADAAGVSRALLYNYFGDKGGLVAAVYLSAFRRLDDELAATIARTRPGEEGLREVVQCFVSFAAANASVCRLINAAEAIDHPLVQRARRTRYERLGAAWGDTPEARLLARGILGLLEAAILDWLETRDCTAERAADVLASLLWSGLAGRPWLGHQPAP